MNEPKPFSLWWLLVAAFIVCVILFDWSYADEGHGHHHDDNGDVITENILTGGDNTASNVASIAGSRSYGLGMGDNDINDCMAHWSALIVTLPARNKFCELTEFSNWAEHTELHTAASITIRCSSKPATDVFGSASQCTENFKPYEVKIVPQTPEDDARIEALYARISEIEAIRIQDKAESIKAAERANLASQRQYQQMQQVEDARQKKLDMIREEFGE